MSDVRKTRGRSAVLAGALIISALVATAIISRLNGGNTGAELEAGSHRRNGLGFAGYQWVNALYTYPQAEAWCRNHGMVLATSDTPEKAEKIRVVSGGRRVWIGYKTGGPGNNKALYRWASGVAWNRWTNWAPGQPDLVAEQCTEQLTNKQWNNLPCNNPAHKRTFVCDKLPYVQSYGMHGVYGPGFTWDEAEQLCRVYYGTGLATVTEPNNMKTVFQSTGVPKAWVGLWVPPNRPWSAAAFVNVNGRPRAPIRWMPGQPNGGDTSRCVEMNNNGDINDIPCQTKLKFILCDQFKGNEDDAEYRFALMDLRIPHRNLKMNKFINFRGRRRYWFNFDVRINALTPGWTNIFHIGNTNHIRVPAGWLYPSHYRKIHFRQRGRVGAVVHWNHGCDPSECHTPRLGAFFKVAILADHGKFTVKYNGHLLCTAVFLMEPYPDRNSIWVSDPWHPAAPVHFRSMAMQVY